MTSIFCSGDDDEVEVSILGFFLQHPGGAAAGPAGVHDK